MTGSARGIGRAIAEALAADGLEVVGVDVLAHDAGVCSRTIAADLADPAACSRVLVEAGPVDVLVNNAALLVVKPIEEFTVEDFDRTVAVNLRAVFLLSQGAVAGMRSRGWGRIVNVSSVGARTGGVSDSTAYAATKAGVIALAKGFARSYGSYGITANAVAPGAVDTAMADTMSAELRASILAQVPLGRFSEPTEVAAIVSFLASDASSFVTGATIDVNGGWVMT